MKITYSNQTVDLFDEKHFPTGAPNKVVLSLSGGCDSASLAFLIATYFPQTEIHPFNCKDGDGLIDTERAISVHKYLQGRFSNIKELELFDKASFWRTYLHLFIKKFIGKNIICVIRKN